MGKVVIVSSDSHAGCPSEHYRDYLEPEYRPLLDELGPEKKAHVEGTRFLRNLSEETLAVIDDRGRMRDGGTLGAWDAARRLQELDAEGVAAEIVLPVTTQYIPPFFSPVNKPYPLDVRAAGARAYNRWVVDHLVVPGNGRLLAIAEPGPCHDLAAVVEDLRWFADQGFVGVRVPGGALGPSVYDAYYEPFWAACADLGLKLVVHVGWGMPDGVYQELMRGLVSLPADSTDGPPENDIDTFGGLKAPDNDESAGVDSDFMFRPRHAMWQLMLGGTFDRHPALKVNLVECRADWIPSTLAYLDTRFEQVSMPCKERPSEYWHDHCVTTPSSPRRTELAIRRDIGIDQFLFGTDFPHPESTWPNTRAWIRHAFAGVPEDDARKILGENAVQFYGLDAERLGSIAARIGHDADELLDGGDDVAPELIADFDSRSGYLKSPEVIDFEALDRMLDRDVANLKTPAGSRAASF